MITKREKWVIKMKKTIEEFIKNKQPNSEFFSTFDMIDILSIPNKKTFFIPNKVDIWMKWIIPSRVVILYHDYSIHTKNQINGWVYSRC